MIYSLQVLDLPKQQHNNILIRTCKFCQVQFTVKCKSIKKQFCSIQCAGKVKRIDHVCIGCGKIFQNYKERHLNRANPKFCTRDCYIENMSKIYGSRFRYNNFYYCDHCCKWIPQKESIIIKNRPTCPNRSCGNNKLKISSQRSLFNQKRKQVKFID